MHIRKFIFLSFIFLPFVYCDDNEVTFSAEEHRVTRRAIEKGLTFLISKQQDNGSFHGDRDKEYAIAVTSFVGLALLADGNLPNRGPHGEQLNKALNYILISLSRDGFISAYDDGSRMHGHCYAALFLAQVYGNSKDYSGGIGRNPGFSVKSVKDGLQRATELIYKSQTADGGWGYLPHDGDHEGSITVCAIQSLRAARNVGIYVPKTVIDRAIEYIRRSANEDGSFKYRLGMNQRRKSFPLAAAGVSSLNGTGEYDSIEIKRGLKFMMQYLPPNGEKDQFYNRFFYYGHFYAVQAMYQAPAHTNYWQTWYPAVRKEFLKSQNQNGSWGNSTNLNSVYSQIGEVYATALATLVLQIPYKYLPIFQK